MKRGDKVLVPNGASALVEGVVESVTDTHAMVKVPEGSMSLGRRTTKALRKLEDLTPVGEKPKAAKTTKKTAKKKTTKKKASKKKTSKKLA